LQSLLSTALCVTAQAQIRSAICVKLATSHYVCCPRMSYVLVWPPLPPPPPFPTLLPCPLTLRTHLSPLLLLQSCTWACTNVCMEGLCSCCSLGGASCNLLHPPHHGAGMLACVSMCARARARVCVCVCFVVGGGGMLFGRVDGWGWCGEEGFF
jgi:hypothetical protein